MATVMASVQQNEIKKGPDSGHRTRNGNPRKLENTEIAKKEELGEKKHKVFLCSPGATSKLHTHGSHAKQHTTDFENKIMGKITSQS